MSEGEEADAARGDQEEAALDATRPEPVEQPPDEELGRCKGEKENGSHRAEAGGSDAEISRQPRRDQRIDHAKQERKVKPDGERKEHSRQEQHSSSLPPTFELGRGQPAFAQRMGLKQIAVAASVSRPLQKSYTCSCYKKSSRSFRQPWPALRVRQGNAPLAPCAALRPRASLVKAIRLYKEAFLVDLAIAEEGWSDWAANERRRLEELAVDAMVQLGEMELSLGRARPALHAAHRALTINNLREDAHRLVLRAMAAAGRRAEALKHYEGLTSLLDRELRADPDAATKSLATEIRHTPAERVVDRREDEDI